MAPPFGPERWPGVPEESFYRPRRMRREMTLPERILWRRLRADQLGVSFRRQHPIGPYIADFYSRRAGLVVEVDGDVHAATGANRDHDLARDQHMERLGLQVLRFSASEVTTNTDGVLEIIAAACVEAVANKKGEIG
jgi:adenine-specific DNA-methyltransferase